MSEPTTAAGRALLAWLEEADVDPIIADQVGLETAQAENEAAAAARAALLDELETWVLEIRPSTPVSREALPMTAGYCDGIDAVLHEISRRRPMPPTTP